MPVVDSVVHLGNTLQFNLLCRVSMVPASQCGGNMDLMQGEYGTSITMWEEHGPYAV